ncbi:MAG: guanine deaminase [Proteobacteria bacterium]|nr:MAG: guanine deaminase [Pseudomonadota bacterium]
MNDGVVVHRGRVLHLTGDPAADGKCEYHADGALVVDGGGRVAAFGAAPELLPALGDGARIIDHRDALIVPGFVDTHVHYPQCGVLASWGAQLLDWLERYTFPAEGRFDDAELARATADFFLDELLRNGTTTALVFGTVHPQSVDAFFEACRVRDLRMLCGKVMMDCHAPDYLLDSPETSFDQSAALIERWHGRGRLAYAVTPRFAPTSSSAQLDAAGRLLAAYPGVRLQTHLSENVDECRWVAELFPQCADYVDVYDRHGLLGGLSVFAHALHLSEREWGRLAQSGSAVSFCPRSNLFIGSGLFDLATADRYGVRVGLGSDVGGGDSFSIPAVVNEGYKVLQLGGQSLDPMRALYLATLGGARVLGLDNEIGNFELGKEADFVVLDPDCTPLMSHRTSRCTTIEETLFAMTMLGDDRLVASTWSLGREVHRRDIAGNGDTG